MKTLLTVLAVFLAFPACALEPVSDRAFAASLGSVHATVRAEFRKSAVRAALLQQEEDTLIELLRDSDPEVRRAAVKALKPYVSRRSGTRERVLELLRGGREAEAVQYEAIKTLSAASGYSEVYERLLEIGKRGPAELRAIAYKALYWQAAARSDVRDDIEEAARREREPAVRRAAIWALFNAVANSRTRDILLEIARRDVDEEARVEALKSLYGARGSYDVRDQTYDMARGRGAAGEVRRAAILMLSYRFNSNETELLQEIAERDADPSMRRAAITALGGPNQEDILRYFHRVRRDANGVMIADPLDYE